MPGYPDTSHRHLQLSYDQPVEAHMFTQCLSLEFWTQMFHRHTFMFKA